MMGNFLITRLSTLTLAIAFSAKKKLVARNQGRCAEKASALVFRITDFFGFSFSIRIPHSTFRI